MIFCPAFSDEGLTHLFRMLSFYQMGVAITVCERSGQRSNDGRARSCGTGFVPCNDMRRHNKFCVLLTVVTFQRLLLKKSSALAEATTESAPMPSVEIACRSQRQVALAFSKAGCSKCHCSI
jgi:hypothetical protein